MITRFRRWSLLASVGAVLLCAAPASAVPLDPSFGQGGRVSLWSETADDVREHAEDFAVAPDGGVYLLESRYPCIPRGRTCGQAVSLARLGPDGQSDPMFAGDGRLELPTVQSEVRTIAVDRRGRPLIGYYEGGQLKVIRADSAGVEDSSFGVNGRVNLPCGCVDPEVHLLPQSSGQIMVVAMWTIRGSAPRHRFRAAVGVFRLRPNGKVDATYGDRGVARMKIGNASEPDHLIALDGGGIAFAGAGGYYGGGPWVARIGARGRFDRRAVRRTRAALRSLLGTREEEKPVGGIVARPGGRLDLFGGHGRHGFVLRLRANGAPERRFWRRGLKILARPVVAVAATPSGRSFVVAPPVESGGWYSEYGLYSAWLDRQDRLLGGFGSGGRALRYTNPFGQLALQRGGRPIYFDLGYPDAGCRSYCPPSPVLYRFKR